MSVNIPKYGTVYLICDPSSDLFKIGVTRGDVDKRISKLQTGNGTEIFKVKVYETPYPYRMEKMLHAHFRNKKELNEWFRLDINDISNFESICKENEAIINSMLENPFFIKDLR